MAVTRRPVRHRVGGRTTAGRGLPERPRAALACDPDLRIRDIAHDIGTTGRAARLITTDEEGRSAGAARERGRAQSVIIRAFVTERNFLDRT
ncbi:hypothetical protein GCM10023178_23150 [Actinomadura luteofluorescens]